MSSFSVNNISQYSQVTELLSVNTIDELKKNQQTLKSLFQGDFATMGYDSKEAKIIEREIEELQALINAQQSKIRTWEVTIFDKQNEIAKAKTDMDAMIAYYSRVNEQKQDESQQRISDITDEVMTRFANGEITQDEIASEIQRGVGNMDANLFNLDTSKIEELSNNIKTYSDDVANLIKQRNIAATKINSAQSSIKLLNEMYQMQIESLGRTATRKGAAAKMPVFTPTQQAYVDELFAKYHTSATPGVDQYSAGNKQVQNLADALGLTKNERGKYEVSEAGQTNYANSVLQEMHDKGFDFVQAMYALDYIMGMNGNVFNYDANSNRMTVAYGHNAPGEYSSSLSDRNSNRIFNSLINQAQTIWTVQNVTRPTEPTPPEPTEPTSPEPTPPTPPEPTPPTPPTPTPPTPTPPTPTPPTPTPPTPVNRTDPIGWAEGDTTYDFIIDRDKNNFFNAVQDAGESNASEFLGALDGIKELTKYDANNDGVIAGDEITNMSNDGIKILKTDHKNMGYGFVTLEDIGIQSINLASMKSQNHTNVNGSQIKNTFGITLSDTRTVTAYQSFDDNDYLNAVYGAVEAHKIASSIDFNKTENSDALELLATDRCFHLADAEVEELKGEVQNILTSMAAKREVSQNRIDNNQRDLKAELSASIRQAEHDAYQAEEAARLAEENRLAREAEQREEKEALSRQLLSVVAQMENLYNEKPADFNIRYSALQVIYRGIASELETKHDVNASDIASLNPEWVSYFDENLNTDLAEVPEEQFIVPEEDPEA